ncbi:hypothetical protein [Evansella clarkii]|uniref:hypothetical protein n=1 Tax=Evansella clarkii TaxID=79879 RepID=UPI000998E580|nr:hypothetical protein [Evansella clarkii]
MSNKGWNQLTLVSSFYVILSISILKLLHDNQSTRYLADPIIGEWGIPKIIFGITLLAALYFIMLRTTRDTEPDKKVTRKTFLKAGVATIGMFLFVMAAQSLRS